MCRKDALIRNLKKHKKQLERDGKGNEAAEYDFYPMTYVLPAEYVLWVEEFKRGQSSTEGKQVWIMKPTGKSQGKGIFLLNRVGQANQWDSGQGEPYIAQRYITDPLLMGGKKFDLRLYVLVTSFSPLTIYAYRDGFARFTHSRYDPDHLTNSQAHLTNVAVQKQA